MKPKVTWLQKDGNTLRTQKSKYDQGYYLLALSVHAKEEPK